MPNILDIPLPLPAIALALLVTACTVPGPPRPGDTGQALPTAAWPEDARIYQVDSEASKLRILVSPDGPLAGLGHYHVIGGPVLAGRVALAEPFPDSALELAIDTTALEVDRPAWRSQEDERFERSPDAEAIAGTRDNLLSEAVLDADRHPRITIESTSLSGPPWQPDITANITLRGITRSLVVPVTLDFDPQRLTATGRLTLNQSDFGLEPFSAAGGSLRVADKLIIRFSITARRTRNRDR